MVARFSRRGFLAMAGTSAVAGCLGGSGTTTENEEERTVVAERTAGTDETTDTAPAEATDVPGSAPPLADFTLPLPMSGDDLRDQARSGGPPKDGIPAIDEPQFVSSRSADDRLRRGDNVFGLVRGDEAKAYPQNVLVWHEIANDVIDGDPVSVTYCPLTGMVQGFDRGSTTFGVSGRLLNNNLIMYDRATENWWPQVLATAIPGPWNSDLAGRTLSEFRVVWTTWGQWMERHPLTKVLSTETGYARNYDRDPYGTFNPTGGYYTSDTTLFPQLGEDDRFHPKAIVLGVRTPGGAAAVPKDALRERGLIKGAIDGTSLVWVYDPGLDTGWAYWNPNELGVVYDDGTVTGPDGSHPAAEVPLERAVTFDGMWFAWSGFYPRITVYD